MNQTNQHQILEDPEFRERLDEGARAVVRALREAGHRALWAGGAVRDRLLGIPYNDIDIATSAEPDEVEWLFPASVLVGKSFGVVRVKAGETDYEVATFRRDGAYLDGRHPEEVVYADHPEVDARRRDFTVNALFYDPLEGRVLDFVGGSRDLASRTLRTVGDPSERFREDRLRLLRAIRFAAQLDFQIEAQTWEAIRLEAHRIGEISVERIRDELLRMLVRPRAGMAFRLLDESGLLGIILPEVERMKGVAQPDEYHPEGDVFIHTLLLLDHLDNPTPELALGALFHDIAKPDTYSVSDRIRFNGHDKLGAEMVIRIADRLRFPNRMTERVRDLVAQHMRIGQAKKMKPSTLKRMLRSELFPELLELHRLDCLASHRDLELHDYCAEHLATLPKEELRPPRLLSGHDLIELGFKPGPKFKEILSEVEDLQLEGRLASREEALEYVRTKQAQPGED
ncbi:MAG: CCA tRNA nucleotidyltransferase [Candidatus Omnitrophica bacterium]|nr:CCA-adding enzyme [bacterium]NUN97153.1 CCA tRNA nucleotidyltransferase [Candidatus Omnitrophota bacterium]